MATIARTIHALPAEDIHGSIDSCVGNTISAKGLEGFVGMGDPCDISLSSANHTSCPGLLAEVVGFQDKRTLLLPYGEPEGIGHGAKVELTHRANKIYPHESWVGRVIGAMADPLDHGPRLLTGSEPRNILNRPPSAHQRSLLGPRMHMGVRALDLFIPCCRGQRLGIFAGSGVGKSTMLSMLARNSDADIMVVGLIGERGREVREFVEKTLGKQGLAKSIVVVATSDMPAMMRRRAAYMTLSIAEYFRDQGKNVLCMLDSVTRFALALREIYLAAGEPPASKGYPPSVFAELPKLLERAGPGCGDGQITGMFTVLVDGDDNNEPISDAVRGILDGHIVMDRKIAEAGRYPAIDVLKSLSRTAPGCYDDHERPLVQRARKMMQTFAEMADLIELGAYKPGSNQALDEAIRLRPAIEALLSQSVADAGGTDDPFRALADIIALPTAAPIGRP